MPNIYTTTQQHIAKKSAKVIAKKDVWRLCKLDWGMKTKADKRQIFYFSCHISFWVKWKLEQHVRNYLKGAFKKHFSW